MPGKVVINPAVFNDKRDAMAVAVNEGLRIFMEDTKFAPAFEPTAEQASFFKGTAYANDPDALKKTILARVATFDTSVKPTPEQVSETLRLLELVKEALGESHQDYNLVAKITEVLEAGYRSGTKPAEEAPAEENVPAQEQAGTTQDDMKGGDVAMESTVPKIAGTATSWSSAVIDFLSGVENFSRDAYPDPKGQTRKWSIGYGNQFHPGQRKPVVRGDTIKEGDARTYMADAVAYNVSRIKGSIGDGTWENLTGGQKLAIVSWAYNVGETKMRSSTLIRRIRDGEPAATVLPQELPKWSDGGRARVRRAKELALSVSDGYE